MCPCVEIVVAMILQFEFQLFYGSWTCIRLHPYLTVFSLCIYSLFNFLTQKLKCDIYIVKVKRGVRFGATWQLCEMIMNVYIKYCVN